MFFMHSFQGAINLAPTRLRESLSYFFRIFKELLNHLPAKADIQTQKLGYEFSHYKQEMVEDDGIEPTTPCLQSRCSPS